MGQRQFIDLLLRFGLQWQNHSDRYATEIASSCNTSINTIVLWMIIINICEKKPFLSSLSSLSYIVLSLGIPPCYEHGITMISALQNYPTNIILIISHFNFMCISAVFQLSKIHAHIFLCLRVEQQTHV